MVEPRSANQVTAESRVEVTRYDRELLDAADESGLAMIETRLRERFSGGIVGEGVATHLRLEREDGSGTLICYERVRCELGGRRGAFLLEASALMTPGLVNGRWTIIEGSGTQGLAGIRGHAAFIARKDDAAATGWTAQTTLTYWFAVQENGTRHASEPRSPERTV